MTDVRLLTQLTDALAAIGRWYGSTADPPRVAASHTHTAPTSTPPLPTAVLSLRRETTDILASWALLVAEERDLRPGINADDVPALTRFLARHADWLADHEAAWDALLEFEHLAGALEEVARACQPCKVTVATCPEPGCAGRLVASVQRGGLLPSIIRCDTDRAHRWDTLAWHALGRRTRPLHPRGVRRLLHALAPSLERPRTLGVADSPGVPDTCDDDVTCGRRTYHDDGRESA